MKIEKKEVVTEYKIDKFCCQDLRTMYQHGLKFDTKNGIIYIEVNSNKSLGGWFSKRLFFCPFCGEDVTK